MINYQLWGTKSSIFPYRSIFHTKSQQQQGVSIKNIKASSKKQSLVGGLEHGFSDFPFSRDFHHPNLPFTPSFFRFFATQQISRSLADDEGLFIPQNSSPTRLLGVPGPGPPGSAGPPWRHGCGASGAAVAAPVTGLASGGGGGLFTAGGAWTAGGYGGWYLGCIYSNSNISYNIIYIYNI